MTPQDDKLVGPDAANEMLTGIPGALEVVLPNTGHMFRFTHPDLYGHTIATFIDDATTIGPANGSSAAGR
ncbi:Uncharacterised protein [Mycobacteroides abscessus subsp. abscessus]|nr:Uncharacterised protein [Mycobacteroides abscessus subsp. abscessus]